MNLTKYQQAEVSTYTLFFLIFIGLFRPLITNQMMDAQWASILTLCFFVWYLTTKFFTNFIMDNSCTEYSCK